MTYKNQTPPNASKLKYRKLLNETAKMVLSTYPSLAHYEAKYVTELMVYYDEDVIGLDGQYFAISETERIE